jgi:lycopene cyclase domain-containing protein
MYAVSLIPFLLINGFLTGSFTSQAVVIYNEAEIIGLRILNIPVEDTIYSFEILLTTVWFYEYFKKKLPF